jgi:hypothetical protein
MAAESETHGCVRCGRPVPLDVALCDTCNPTGLAQPAPTQAHGTVLVAIIGAVAVLALLAGLARSSVGPFEATIDDAVAVPPTIMLTISATNHGSSDSPTRCRVTDDEGRTAIVATERIAAGATVTFTRVVTDLSADPTALHVTCDP